MARSHLHIGIWILLAILVLQCSIFQPGDGTVDAPAGSDQVTGGQSNEQLPTGPQSAIATLPAAPPEQPAPAGHPPTIISVDVPALIPATGEKVPATITCTNAAQDVVSVHFRTISPPCCIPDSTLDATTRSTQLSGGGVITFEISCDRPQRLTMTATLRDFEMQEGNAYPFSYTCQ